MRFLKIFLFVAVLIALNPRVGVHPSGQVYAFSCTVQAGGSGFIAPRRTIEAKDRHEFLAIAQRLYLDLVLAVACNED